MTAGTENTTAEKPGTPGSEVADDKLVGATTTTTTTTNIDKEVHSKTTSSSGGGDDNDSDNEPVPHLHAKTFLAVIAVCLIYMAQLVNLVGAGAQGQTIAAHFGNTAKVVWFSAPITIMTVVLGPIVSQAADY